MKYFDQAIPNLHLNTRKMQSLCNVLESYNKDDLEDLLREKLFLDNTNKFHAEGINKLYMDIAGNEKISPTALGYYLKLVAGRHNIDSIICPLRGGHTRTYNLGNKNTVDVFLYFLKSVEAAMVERLKKSSAFRGDCESPEIIAVKKKWGL